MTISMRFKLFAATAFGGFIGVIGFVAGYEAKIELKELVSGRKRFRGTVEGTDGNEVRIEVELDQIGRQIVGFPVDMIAEARLVLTDALIREALRRSKKQVAAAAAGTGPADEIEPEDS